MYIALGGLKYSGKNKVICVFQVPPFFAKEQTDLSLYSEVNSEDR